MNSLVGYTGFVGQNIARSFQFDGLYNSQNIQDAFGTNPDLLVYSGVRAEMFLANHHPEQDLQQIQQAIENIKRINPRYLVLISTISVYGGEVSGNENTVIDQESLTAYGKNRLYLERWVEGSLDDYLIIRLPAIYGIGIKKNFIYDYIHIVPGMLNHEKYEELLRDNRRLCEFYEKQDNGFYRCRTLLPEEKRYLIGYFKGSGFSALSFTDSRSRYQFYNLKYLWKHIETARNSGIHKLNLVTEPLEIQELFSWLEGQNFENRIMEHPYNYNLHSVHYKLLGGSDGYIFDKESVKDDIKTFVQEARKMEGLL